MVAGDITGADTRDQGIEEFQGERAKLKAQPSSPVKSGNRTIRPLVRFARSPGLSQKSPASKQPSGKINHMETELYFGQQKIRFDREATATLYRDLITVAAADSCTCISCKNFTSQRASVYPEEFVRFLKELGVDPPREWDAFDYDFGPENPNIHLYGGWFLFCGELIEGLERTPELGTGTFAHSFTASFPASTLPKEVKLCAVEFLAQIPWFSPKTPNQAHTET